MKKPKQINPYKENHKMNEKKRNPVWLPVAALSAMVLIFTGAAMHHGWANYDQETVLNYTGTILENDIGNPHTYIDLEVHDFGEESDGEIDVWNVVLAPLARMENRGLSDHAMLAVGDTVRVEGYPHRTVEDEMRAERIHIGDVTIELR